MKSRSLLLPITLGLMAVFASSAQSQVASPTLQSLRQVPVPNPSNLSTFVADRQAAIRLGKALFWDMRVGSDGVSACASCHFHAGVDNRSKNQLSPGLLIVDTQGRPAPDPTFQVGGPNYQLKTTDFPFRKLKNVDDAKSTVIRDRNDVSSSQGVFLRQFLGLDAANNENNLPVADAIFHVGVVNTRRVEPRNSPTVINAVFNQRNFWDGRAVDIFNGVNPFGRRDAAAKVFIADNPGVVRAVSVSIDNSSLASQASGPPLSAFEMSSAGKLFPDLGRRLLSARPLALQKVDAQDSVLGPLSQGQAPGLSVADYATLIRQAFRPEWWQGTMGVQVDTVSGTSRGTAQSDSSRPLAAATQSAGGGGMKPAATYTQMEANFSLFFGLSVQMYEATLVSDQTPYDAYAEGNAAALTDQQKLGLGVFLNKGRCVNCHKGAEFTAASVQNVGRARLERMVMGDGQNGVYDAGFYNIGVRPTREDLGVGSIDPFDFPLSEARLLSQFGPTVYQNVVGVAPNLTLSPAERVVADGAFKTPGLRNIELTAPFFHNGGQRTLREVVEFYNRGGDFAARNIVDLDADIVPLGLSLKEKDALVAFMRALTDERVRYRKAPFDHPQLLIPNGHVGDTVAVVNSGNGEATDIITEVPATGRNGGTPLRSFLE